MRIIKKQKLVLIVLSLVLISAGTLLAKYEPKEDLAAFYKSQPSTEETIVSYHGRMNDLFNDKIDLLINNYDKAVDTVPETNKTCEANNVSTYCLSELAVEEFFAFREAMIERKQELEFGSVQGAEQQDKLITDLADLQTGKDVLIDTEIDVAYETMDAALKAYNELHRAYPLHKKYKEIIKELEKYRDMLVEIRHQIEFFPNKFIDASTTQCK